jgi:FkbM family methyltransferase
MELLLGLIDRLPASWVRAAGAARGRSRWVKTMTDWLPGLLRNREGRIQKGLGRGLRFNPGPSAVGFLFGTHDLEVQFVLGRLLRPGMTVFDVGANVGFTAMLAAKQVLPGGRVVCFEPLPANAEQIHHNTRLNAFSGIDVRVEALGRQDGQAEFTLSHSPTWGRLADAGPTPQASGTTRVNVRSLDSLRAYEEIRLPDLIKMDVEGAEADALAGAIGVLREARPVLVIELHHTARAVAAVLSELPYTLRVLGSETDIGSLEGEGHALAYPTGHADAEAVWRDTVQGRHLR